MTESGQLRLPSCWGVGAGEVERQPVAGDRRPQHDPQVAVARLEHVLGACARRRRASRGGACAALGVVEHLIECAARRLGPTRRASSPVAGRRPVGGELRAKIGAPLGAAAASGATSRAIAASSQAPWGSITTPSSSSVRLSAGIEPGVGPPTSAWWARVAANPISCAVGEHGRDHGDVGQVGAAAVRVVEDPRAPRRLLARRAPRRPRPASRRGGPGCARPASPSRPRASNSARRGVAALLDVGRVRRADQHRAHLLADACSAPVSDLELDRVEPLIDPLRRSLIVPSTSTRAVPAGRPPAPSTPAARRSPAPESRSPAQARRARPPAPAPGRRARRSAAPVRAACACSLAPSASARPGDDRRHAHGHELDLLPARRGSRSARSCAASNASRSSAGAGAGEPPTASSNACPR